MTQLSRNLRFRRSFRGNGETEYPAIEMVRKHEILEIATGEECVSEFIATPC